MATMTATNVRDVGPKDVQTRNNASTRIDLANIADVPYYVEKRYVRAVDNGDEFQYEEVPVEEFYDDDKEDTLDALIRNVKDQQRESQVITTSTSAAAPRGTLTTQPEAVDDFVRNFLVRMGMKKTMQQFQIEWHNLSSSGRIKTNECGYLPDVVKHNEELSEKMKLLESEVDRYRKSAEKAREEFVKMKKERDYHRQHHNRIAQEKNNLVTFVKRLKSHLSTFEPQLDELKSKYDGAMREKMVYKLEKEKLQNELNALKLGTSTALQNTTEGELGPTQTKLRELRHKEEKKKQAVTTEQQRLSGSTELTNESHPRDSEFPVDTGNNPYLNRFAEDAFHRSTLTLAKEIEAHEGPISCAAIHPRKHVAVTVSDDRSWKMWAIPEGDMIMKGEGHSDWVSGIDFHPSGNKMATCSGDTSIKIWDFSQKKCIHTFTNHLLPVWSVHFHSCGDFIASASQDKTVRLWDLNSLRCRTVMRGHQDSVHSAELLMFSNIILSSSVDKSLMLWDARTGLAEHTFVGHVNPCNQATFNLRGDTIASCDSKGIVKLWDVRTIKSMVTLDLGPYSANSVSFHPAGQLLTAASSDRTIKLYNIGTEQLIPLSSHHDEVQYVKFDLKGQYMVSTGRDRTLRVWSSYLIIVPKLLKVGYDNQLSIFIAAASEPVEVKFNLTLGQKYIQSTITVKSGETRNATLTLPFEFPAGVGELTIVGSGGIRFKDKRDIIVYDNRYVVLVQTSASTYHPGDIMEIRVVATNEELMPIENGEVLIEVYDANFKRVGEFATIPIHSGITETFKFSIGTQCNTGTWLVSATIGNTTSSVEVLVARPVTPSFDVKAIFQRFLLRTDKTLRGIIEMHSDNNMPIFGRVIMAVGQITEQDMKMMNGQQNLFPQQGQQILFPQQGQQNLFPQQGQTTEEWRTWKSRQFEIAGRVEINYDLLSLFNIDVTKAVAIRVYIQVANLVSDQERIIEHVIPVFIHNVIYDIHPLHFETGMKNEFKIIAKRPDGKPAKMENLIVTVSMMMSNEQGKVQEEKSVDIKDFYTRGRNDIGLFNIELPDNCIGVLMTITPLSEDGNKRGYRTHAVPLMPTPRRGTSGAKLSIELLPTTTSKVQIDANVPVVSSQISTVGHTSKFYIQLTPSKAVKKFEPLPMSYVLLTNGRITHTGEFIIQPTNECQSRSQRSIISEEQVRSTCVFNGTLSIEITRDMMPYSSLLVYTFQPSFGFNVAESYRFSVAGLFQNTLQLKAAIVPFISTNTMITDEDNGSTKDLDSLEHVVFESVSISNRAQGKSRIELSLSGPPNSIVGVNVIEYDSVIQGLPNEITKERLLQYLTTYEQVPIVGMPTIRTLTDEQIDSHTHEVDTTDGNEVQYLATTMRRDDKEHQTQDMESTTSSYNMNDEVTDEMDLESQTMHLLEGFDSEMLIKKPSKTLNKRAIISEEEEENNIHRERLGFKIRYPIEKLIFGSSSSRSLRPIDGDDVYTTTNMERLYGDINSRRLHSHYHRRTVKSLNQYDTMVNDNDYVVTASIPLVTNSNVEVNQQNEPEEPDVQSLRYGTPSWYEKINLKLSLISQEALIFMQSALIIVSDFSSLYIPPDISRSNLTKLFSKYREQLIISDSEPFDIRDEARQLLEEYFVESDLSMIPPQITLEEQARIGYYRSIFFHTTRIESQGTGKVLLPRSKPYATWLATGFALNSKTGLSVAQPIRLPTNYGLFIFGKFPDQVQTDEQALLTYGINNYLDKDLTNVVVRIRTSTDFHIIEQDEEENVRSSTGQDYTITFPSIKSLGVETHDIILIPKYAGVVKIILEVESEFGGDYEILTTYVRESDIERKQITTHLYDLTNENKTYGPIVENVTTSTFLRSVQIAVSGTGLDHLVKQNTMEINSLIGIDRAIVHLWRLLGLYRYFHETSQMESTLLDATMRSITIAYQNLQFYNNYNGSYSFISNQDEQKSSLYLTSLAFGALISPFITVHDNVAINRTLTWILSHQQNDGSFDDQGSCFHYRICSGKFHRESLTAIVLYTMTYNNVSQYGPEFVHRRLYNGEQSPIVRAQHFLESRLDAVKSCLLTTTLIELALVQCQSLSKQFKEKIYENVRNRQLTVLPEDGSKFLKTVNENITFDDQLLINALTLSIYANYNDWKTTLDIARWMVEQIEIHPCCSTVLDDIFYIEAWLKTAYLFHQYVGSENFSVLINVTADNGQHKEFNINSSNMDITQKLSFSLPVNQITYTVSGFGIASVNIEQIYMEKEQQTVQPVSFQLTNEYLPLSLLNEITARTCLIYTPTSNDQKLAKDISNRTIIVEIQIPSGVRVNLRQIGFFLSRVPEAMYFTFNERTNKINFFFNIPSAVYGKQICFNWRLERLSIIVSWTPIQIRAYDYLQPESQLIRLFPVEIESSFFGYSSWKIFMKLHQNLNN
ncbi:unnamed protein product [Rotaria sordida]|uniref:Guanine nucleotide-binding protein subunit beta-like protein n=1 Tax=Rotaria sordida TaxID=392033 RepID=A0A818XTF0_9BILA|nr:unnamed protein product [Rotaria sordida]